MIRSVRTDDERDFPMRGSHVPDSKVDDPPLSTNQPLLPSSDGPLTPPLDLYSLSQPLGSPTPPQGPRSFTSTLLGVLMLSLVLILMVVFGIGYVVLGARLNTPTAWSWLSTALIIFVVHAAIFDPLRILFVAFYWTIIFRYQLMP